MQLTEPRTFQWTRDRYYRAAETGLFDGQHVQLIEGEVVEMAPQKGTHAAAVTLALYALQRVFAAGWTVRIQLPLALSEISEPEPDLALIQGNPRDLGPDHPCTAALAVEISDTTLAFDRRRKAALYAATGIPEYWILNLLDRRLEVHRSPTTDPSPHYQQTLVLAEEESVTPLAAPEARIAVRDLLP